jgi:hypothetical protein
VDGSERDRRFFAPLLFLLHYLCSLIVPASLSGLFFASFWRVRNGEGGREEKCQLCPIPTISPLPMKKIPTSTWDFKFSHPTTMSSNLKNDGLVGLQNDDLDRDGLAMVVDDDNYEIMFEGKTYHSYEDYVQAKRSRTAGIFADDSAMLAAGSAIVEEMTAPGPRRAKNPRDDLAMPPLLPRRKSSRIARTVSEDPPLSEMIFPDAEHNFLADSLNLESLDSVITFHARMCNAEGCNGPCNHDDKIITGASFDSDDDEDDHGPSDHLDDEDYSMESAPVTASKPASEAMIAELKTKCINTINDNLATFPASLRGDFIERARTAVIGEKFYWCQGLCDYYTKSMMSGETLEGVDRSKCPSAQFNDQILVRIAQTLATGIMFCNFRGECKRKPDGKNCMEPTPEEAIKIVEVIIAFARLADALRGAVVLQICGGKQASKVMLPKLKERMKSSGVGIIILNENSFHMSFYGYINLRVFFTKDLQQYLVYKDFHQLYLSLAEALEQLKTMGILDLRITFSQMLEWAQPLAGIKDHSNTPAETTNA